MKALVVLATENKFKTGINLNLRCSLLFLVVKQNELFTFTLLLYLLFYYFIYNLLIHAFLNVCERLRLGLSSEM